MDRSVHSHASAVTVGGVTWPAGFNGTPPRHWVGVFLNARTQGVGADAHMNGESST